MTRDGGSQVLMGDGDRPQWTVGDRGIVVLRYPGLVYRPATTQPLSRAPDARVLVQRPRVEQFSLSAEHGLVAFTSIPESRGAVELWLVKDDGIGARRLLRGGYAADPAWRPATRSRRLSREFP